MLDEWIDSKILVAINIIMLFPCLMLSVLLSPTIIKLKKIFLALKQGALVIIFIWLLSPILESFYKNYASNTTYAISYGLIVIHLVFKDYAYVYSKEYIEFYLDFKV